MSAFYPTTVVVTPEGKLIVTLIGDAIELWKGMRIGYEAVRAVVTDPATQSTYPETTYGDIVAIVEIWERAFGHDYRSEQELRVVRLHWQDYLARLALEFKNADPAARFPGNREFWLAQSRLLATLLSRIRIVPTRTSIALASFKEGVESYYGGMLRMALHPRETLAGIARTGAELLADVADASTKPWRNLFGGWKVPLLIGAAVVAAIVIVPPLVRRAPLPLALPRTA